MRCVPEQPLALATPKLFLKQQVQALHRAYCLSCRLRCPFPTLDASRLILIEWEVEISWPRVLCRESTTVKIHGIRCLCGFVRTSFFHELARVRSASVKAESP